MAINWRRGLLRGWIAIAVIWVAVAFVMVRPEKFFIPFDVTINSEDGQTIQFPSTITDSNARKAFSDYYAAKNKENVFNQFDVPPNVVDIEVRKVRSAIDDKQTTLRANAETFIILGVLPPIGLLMLGAIVGWILRGFRAERSI